jgi:hypothetical protein
VLMLQCALKMRESLPQLIGYAKMQQIGIDIPDFLEPSYFDRVQVYMECLSIVNSVSLLFQTRKFPAGHLVVFVYRQLVAQFALLVTDHHQLPRFHQTFKKVLYEGVNEILIEPVMSTATMFIRSGVLHPSVCYYLQKEEYVPADVFTQTVVDLKADIAALIGSEENGAYRTAFFTLMEYLEWCKTLFSRDTEPVFGGFPAVTETGEICGIAALDFWRKVDSDANTIHLASMVLVLPAGKLHDEFVFSTTGQIFSKITVLVYSSKSYTITT